jgi:hypothetical protein
MGMWALAPWDNDSAADWYTDLLDRTQLRKAWLETIALEPAQNPDEVRAAAALFIMLGRVYIWPIDHYDKDLELAITALEGVSRCEEYKEVADLLALISEELEELKSRRKPGSGESPVASKKPWWKLWS